MDGGGKRKQLVNGNFGRIVHANIIAHIQLMPEIVPVHAGQDLTDPFAAV
jgi:hypothetical protein